MKVNVARLSDVRNNLGEGPFWDVKEQLLYYVDMRGKTIWRHDPRSGASNSWSTPEEAVGVNRAADGRFVAVLADGFYEFDPGKGTFSLLSRVPGLQLELMQLSESKVDRQGRFVAGGAANGDVPLAELPPNAKIVSLNGGEISTLDTGYRISNGASWSLDGTTMYLTESITKKIYAYDYDPETGRVGERRLFADIAQIPGVPEGAMPDGATVDARGRLWSAIVGAGRIVCFSPDGVVEEVLEIPVTWITSLTFGGPDLDQMYITSMEPTFFGLPPDEVSGYLYRVDGHGARGLAEPAVKLSR